MIECVGSPVVHPSWVQCWLCFRSPITKQGRSSSQPVHITKLRFSSKSGKQKRSGHCSSLPYSIGRVSQCQLDMVSRSEKQGIRQVNRTWLRQTLCPSPFYHTIWILTRWTTFFFLYPRWGLFLLSVVPPATLKWLDPIKPELPLFPRQPLSPTSF